MTVPERAVALALQVVATPPQPGVSYFAVVWITPDHARTLLRRIEQVARRIEIDRTLLGEQRGCDPVFFYGHPPTEPGGDRADYDAVDPYDRRMIAEIAAKVDESGSVVLGAELVPPNVDAAACSTERVEVSARSVAWAAETDDAYLETIYIQAPVLRRVIAEAARVAIES